MQFLARQADFDQIVTEFLKERGDSGGEIFLHDAVQEAIETFENSHYDLSGVFVYTSKKEFELKFSFEARCRALEAAATSQITDVNMMFCIQGMQHIIKDDSSSSLSGILRIIEGRNLIATVLTLLCQTSKGSSDDGSQNSNAVEDDGDDSDEDASEDCTLQRLALLELLTSIFTLGDSHFREWKRHAILSEQTVTRLCEILDEEMTETKVVKIFLVFLFLVVTKAPENKPCFADHGIVDLLSLCKKVNNKDEEIVAKVDRMVEIL